MDNNVDVPREIFAAIHSADPSRPFVIAQLGQSLDGRIATQSGESRDISGPAALDHLHALRAHVDAVIVGVGTVIADDPKLNVRRVAGRSPARVIIDPNGRMPGAARVFCKDDVNVLVIRAVPMAAPDSPLPCGEGQGLGVDASLQSVAHPHPCPSAQGGGGARDCISIVLPAGADGRIPPQAIIAALFARGMKKLLVEGGANTISTFIDADCVDRLHLLVAPMIIGSGKPGLSLDPVTRLSDALCPQISVYPLPGGDVLFDCDLRARRAPPRRRR